MSTKVNAGANRNEEFRAPLQSGAAPAETSTPVWPVPGPEIPGKQVDRLRKAYAAQAFRASSLGPGDPERALPGAARQGWYFFLGSAATFCVAAFAMRHASPIVRVPLIVVGLPAGLLAIAVCGAAIITVVKRLSRRGRAIIRWRGRYLLPAELEPTEIALVERAAQAANQVAASATVHEGRLTPAGGDLLLARNLWHIAVHARHVSALRRALGSSPHDVHEVVSAALAPAAIAIDTANAAVLARVAALESYAEHVAWADDALHALIRGREIGQRSERVAELIADMDWDPPALDDTMLAAQVSSLQQIWERKVADALAAARALPDTSMP